MERITEMCNELFDFCETENFKEFGFSKGGKYWYWIQELDSMQPSEQTGFLYSIAFRLVVNGGNKKDEEITELKKLLYADRQT